MSTTIESVLVVDDDEHLLHVLARTFAVRRRTFMAKKLEDAVEVAGRARPHLAVIDLRLGEVSGLDVVRAVKEASPTTTVALISGYLTINATVAAVRAGAALVVSKPVRANEILRRLGVEERTSRDLTPTLVEAQVEHIVRVMKDTEGNVSEAARRLGIHRASLVRKIRRHRLVKPVSR